MTNISVLMMIALAQLAGEIDPLPVEPWTLEPIVVIQTCREEPEPYGAPKWAWRDVNGEAIEWCQSI